MFFSSCLIASLTRFSSFCIQRFQVAHKLKLSLFARVFCGPFVSGSFINDLVCSNELILFSFRVVCFYNYNGKVVARINCVSPSLSCSLSSNVSGCCWFSSSSLRSSRGWYPSPNLYSRFNNFPSISAIFSRLLFSSLEGTQPCLCAFMSVSWRIVPGRKISCLLSTSFRVYGLFLLFLTISMISSVLPQWK